MHLSRKSCQKKRRKSRRGDAMMLKRSGRFSAEVELFVGLETKAGKTSLLYLKIPWQQLCQISCELTK